MTNKALHQQLVEVAQYAVGERIHSTQVSPYEAIQVIIKAIWPLIKRELEERDTALRTAPLATQQALEEWQQTENQRHSTYQRLAEALKHLRKIARSTLTGPECRHIARQALASIEAQPEPPNEGSTAILADSKKLPVGEPEPVSEEG